MMSGSKTSVLYAILAILFAILVADATRLIDINDFLEQYKPSNRGQTTSAVSRVDVHQIDNQGLDIRIEYFLEKKQESGQLRVTVLDMDNGATHMAGSLTDITPGHGTRTISLKRRARSMPTAFSTTHVRVWLNDVNGNPLADRLVISNLEWPPAHLSSVNIISNMPKLRSKLVELFEEDNYTLLDELCKEWKTSRHKTDDGQWALAAFEALPSSHEVKDDWRGVLKNIQDWRASSPGSECAILAEAMLWFRRAWNERGYKRKEELSEIAMQLFRDKLTKAADILAGSRQQLAGNPMWYSAYMDVLTQLGYGKDAVLRIFVDAVDRENSYYPSYISAAYSLLPRWGGNYQALEIFIQKAVTSAESEESDALYARIYWHIDEYLDPGVKIFEDTHASWPRMQKGFEALLAKYPRQARIRNYFASYACRAGDGDTYLRIRRKLNADNIQGHVWKYNYPLDVCDHMYMQRI